MVYEALLRLTGLEFQGVGLGSPQFYMIMCESPGSISLGAAGSEGCQWCMIHSAFQVQDSLSNSIFWPVFL